jgi:hypothetical protein
MAHFQATPKPCREGKCRFVIEELVADLRQHDAFRCGSNGLAGDRRPWVNHELALIAIPGVIDILRRALQDEALES